MNLFDVGLANDLGPPGDIPIYLHSELFRGSADRGVSNRREAFLHLTRSSLSMMIRISCPDRGQARAIGQFIDIIDVRCQVATGAFTAAVRGDMTQARSFGSC
jgi:hypothetical protein